MINFLNKTFVRSTYYFVYSATLSWDHPNWYWQLFDIVCTINCNWWKNIFNMRGTAIGSEIGSKICNLIILSPVFSNFRINAMKCYFFFFSRYQDSYVFFRITIIYMYCKYSIYTLLIMEGQICKSYSNIIMLC